MKKLFLTLLFLLTCASAQAKQWQVDYAHSALGFIGDQNGEKFSGGFKKFTAQIDFDPANPQFGKINAVIDIASAYAGDKDRDDMLPQKDWFDSSKFPQATFTSTSIKKTSDGHYEMDGTLSIKGVTKYVTLPFTLVPEGDHYRAQGKLTLMRNDFTVGMGMFTGENYVKNAVDVTVDLIAR